MSHPDIFGRAQREFAESAKVLGKGGGNNFEGD